MVHMHVTFNEESVEMDVMVQSICFKRSVLSEEGESLRLLQI